VVLNNCCEHSVDGLRYFRVMHNSIRGVPVTISRTGYTGDLGYEIWIDAGSAIGVWDSLIEAGHGYGIAPCGILAMDMARVEAGLFMLDVDYTSSHSAWIESQKSTPFELGLDWAVHLDKSGYFVGREALEREARDGPAWKMVGVEIDWEGMEKLFAAARTAAANPGHGGSRQPADLPGIAAGRLRIHQHLVAGAEEIHRAGASATSLVRSRHARDHGSHGGAPAQAGAGHRGQAALLRAGMETQMNNGSNNYDAVIIGGGHNGLISACLPRQAAASARWCSSGARSSAGQHSPQEVFPGYRFSEWCPTSSACCAPRSSATCSCRVTGCTSCRSMAPSRRRSRATTFGAPTITLTRCSELRRSSVGDAEAYQGYGAR
jgi:hypothetical protein